jgi:hypothetical protein
MGLAAPRESFAVVSVEGENESRGLFTIQEAIDRYFFTARWGPDAWKNGTQLWKMGDRHNNFKDSPKVKRKRVCSFVWVLIIICCFVNLAFNNNNLLYSLFAIFHR